VASACKPPFQIVRNRPALVMNWYLNILHFLINNCGLYIEASIANAPKFIRVQDPDGIAGCIMVALKGLYKEK
jgi:hypothetical protein